MTLLTPPSNAAAVSDDGPLTMDGKKTTHILTALWERAQYELDMAATFADLLKDDPHFDVEDFVSGAVVEGEYEREVESYRAVRLVCASVDEAISFATESQRVYTVTDRTLGVTEYWIVDADWIEPPCIVGVSVRFDGSRIAA